MWSMYDSGAAKLERSFDRNEVIGLMMPAGGPTNREGGSYDFA